MWRKTDGKHTCTWVSQKGTACVQMLEDTGRPLNWVEKWPSRIQRDVLELNNWDLLRPSAKECYHTLLLERPGHNGCWGALKHTASRLEQGQATSALSVLTHSSRFIFFSYGEWWFQIQIPAQEQECFRASYLYITQAIGSKCQLTSEPYQLDHGIWMSEGTAIPLWSQLFGRLR